MEEWPIILQSWPPHVGSTEGSFDEKIPIISKKTCQTNRYEMYSESIVRFINSLSTSVVLANSLDPDQARRLVGPDQGPNCLTF